MAVRINLGVEYWFRGRRVVPIRLQKNHFGRESQVTFQDSETLFQSSVWTRHFREEATFIVQSP